jgi:hypothetical protein
VLGTLGVQNTLNEHGLGDLKGGLAGDWDLDTVAEGGVAAEGHVGEETVFGAFLGVLGEAESEAAVEFEEGWVRIQGGGDEAGAAALGEGDEGLDSDCGGLEAGDGAADGLADLVELARVGVSDELEGEVDLVRRGESQIAGVEAGELLQELLGDFSWWVGGDKETERTRAHAAPPLLLRREREKKGSGW